MNIETFLMDMLYIVLVAAIPILTNYLVAFLESKKSQIDDNKKNLDFANTLSKALDIVTTTVKYVSQTYVDDLKKQGKFDATAQEEALKKAIETIQSQLDEDTKELLITAYGDLQTWIRVQIEAAIKDSK